MLHQATFSSVQFSFYDMLPDAAADWEEVT